MFDDFLNFLKKTFATPADSMLNVEKKVSFLIDQNSLFVCLSGLVDWLQSLWSLCTALYFYCSNISPLTKIDKTQKYSLLFIHFWKPTTAKIYVSFRFFIVFSFHRISPTSINKRSYFVRSLHYITFLLQFRGH